MDHRRGTFYFRETHRKFPLIVSTGRDSDFPVFRQSIIEYNCTNSQTESQDSLDSGGGSAVQGLRNSAFFFAVIITIIILLGASAIKHARLL